MKSWRFGAVVLTVVATAACGSSESTMGTSGNTGGASSTGNGGSGGGNGGATSGTMASTGTETPSTTGTMAGTGTGATSTGAGTSTGSGGGTCEAATNCSLCKAQDKTCSECCGKAHPDAKTKYNSLLIANCICEGASPCFAACGGAGGTMPPVCADPTAVTAACAMCVNGLGMNACVMKTQQSCAADTVCKDLVTCVLSCAG